MDDNATLTTAIAEDLVALAETLAPHLAGPGDDGGREALVRRLHEALTPEWHVLDASDALDDLAFGATMVLFGAERLGVRR